MSNIFLKEITESDVDELDNSEYSNLDKEKRLELISCSKNAEHDGKYFKFYLLKKGQSTIGFINVSANSKNVCSVAPEIKEEFRQKGYATDACVKMFEELKRRGFKIAMATIREDNLASIALNEKLEFEYVKSYVGKSGKVLKLYLKPLY